MKKMNLVCNIYSNLLFLLEQTDQYVIDLFTDLHEYILEIYPNSTELLYHTHALTAVFSISEKLSDAFCMLPIYTKHLNLVLNKGTLIDDPHKLLTGTGELIRHIPVATSADYRKKQVKDLIQAAVEFAIQDMEKPTKSMGKTISKITKDK